MVLLGNLDGVRDGLLVAARISKCSSYCSVGVLLLLFYVKRYAKTRSSHAGLYPETGASRLSATTHAVRCQFVFIQRKHEATFGPTMSASLFAGQAAKRTQ